MVGRCLGSASLRTPVVSLTSAASSTLKRARSVPSKTICRPLAASKGPPVDRTVKTSALSRESAAPVVRIPQSTFVRLQSIKFIHSLIHSFRLFLQRLFKSTSTQRRSRHSTETVSTFHRQLQVKDLPKVPTWQLKRDSNPRPFGRGIENTNEPPRFIVTMTSYLIIYWLP